MAKRHIVAQPQLYGLPSALNNQTPPPIVAQRAPTSSDQAYPGQLWIDQASNTPYILTTAGNWSTLAAEGGAGVFTTLSSAGSTNLNASANYNTDINTGTSTGTVTIGNVSSGAISLVSGSSTASAIELNTTSNTGGITLSAGNTFGIALDAGGAVTMVPATYSTASPTATVAVTNEVTSSTWTGFTTAAAGTQAFTFTNASMLATSVYFVTATNGGTNAALMTVTGVKPAAGSVVVTLTNNGSAALNGNIVLNIWWIA